MIIISTLFSLFITNIWVIFGGIIVKYIINKRLRYIEDISILKFNSIYYIFIFVIIFLVFCNINQFAGVLLLFYLFIFTTPVLIIYFFVKFAFEKKKAIMDLGSIFFIQIICIIFISYLFDVLKLWINEGPNHDSLIYYQGMIWALENKLQFASENVIVKWNFLHYPEIVDGFYIGVKNKLYRGGTYTIAAWSQLIAPEKTGSGLWLSSVYAVTIFWMGIRFVVDITFKTTNNLFIYFLTICLSVVVSTSTAHIGAIENSNLGTVFAAAVIFLVFVVGICSFRETHYTPFAILFGLLVALSSHFYSEALYITGFLSISYLIMNWYLKKRAFTKIIKSILIFMLTLILFSNFVIVNSIYSLILISKIDHAHQIWASWYIHQNIFLWIGAFIENEILGHSNTVNPYMLLIAILVTSVSVIVCLKSKNKLSIIPMIILSFIMISLVELLSYDYGEHKVIQLLGPSWIFIVIYSWIILISEIMNNNIISNELKFNYFIIIVFLIITTLFINIEYCIRVKKFLKYCSIYYGIKYGNEQTSKFIKEGDNVAFEDSSLVGVEKFHKGHYAAFFIHSKKGKILFPCIDQDVLRGGYYRRLVNNTFVSAKNVQWILTGNGFNKKKDIFINKGEKLYKFPDYNLIKLMKNNYEVILPSNGWYDYEKEFIWTRSPFFIEVYLDKNNLMKKNLIIDIERIFPNKENENINVYLNSNLIIKQKNITKRIKVPLKQGFNKIMIETLNKTYSPLDLGMSSDDRKLFLAIKKVYIE